MVFNERKRADARNGKGLRVAVAALTAVATLAGGGMVAATAMADGGGGWAPGSAGSVGGSVIGWAYEDNNNGGFGGATLDAFKKAVAKMGATYNNYNGGADKAANTAITMANNECVARFNDKHPGETANCRMVAVGVVATPTTHSYSGEGFADAPYWSDAWNKNIAPGVYRNNGVSYDTDDGFSDAPERSVDSIAASQWNNSPVAIVIMLNQYEPVQPNYHLSVSTQAAEMSGQSGDTKDASDTITLSSDGSKTENVNGTATLHWRGIDGTEKTVAKQFTASNKGGATVSASFKDMDASWESWPAGKRWWDVDVAKQGNMAEAVSHKGENDGKESGEKTTTPPEKWLTNGAGDTVRDGNDSIASGSLYTAHIKAHSNASGKFWIYDTIDTKDVVIGGTDKDDVSKVNVTDANGNVVKADISIDDSIDGKRVVKAHATAPHSGLYTLNVP
ncbi:adhesin, partial [Bifidobacterium longum]|nr:adhesin [Bifidobacterium longum]